MMAHETVRRRFFSLNGQGEERSLENLTKENEKYFRSPS